MKAASLFSGIGAPECAMPHWDWLWHAEIEAFPSAVMAARHPKSVNLGDVNAEDFVERALAIGRPDVLVFGSPCQDFSVAGKRVGLDGARGNLALVALRVARELGVGWLVFENVPGLLSSYSGSAEAERALGDQIDAGVCRIGERVECDEDSDFAAFLSAVRECGHLGCYRVLDAQFAGVPQRRRRVFFVGRLGDWRGPAAVLFEPESLRGDPPPGRQAREGIAGTIGASLARCSADEGERGNLIGRSSGNGFWSEDDQSSGLRSSPAHESTLVAGTLDAAGGKSRGAGTPPGMVVADPITANEGATYTHEGKHFRPHNLVFGVPDPAYALSAGNQNDGGVFGSGRDGQDTFVVGALQSSGKAAGSATQQDAENGMLVPDVIAFDTTQITHPENRSKPDDRSPQLAAGAHPPAIAFSCKDHGADASDDGITPTLRSMDFDDSHANGGGQIAVAFQARVGRNGRGAGEEVVPALNGSDAGATSDMRPCVAVFKPSHFTRDKDGAPSDLSAPLSADADNGDQDPVLLAGAAVRRLTPRECERLQDFEDDYTLIRFRGKPAADGPRYRALGNSMAVCVVRSILTRLEKVDQVLAQQRSAADGEEGGGPGPGEASEKKRKRRRVHDRGGVA